MQADSSLTRCLRLTIFTDNQNTVNNVDLRVIHVRGKQTAVADALLRRDFPKATELALGLSINFFTPPQDVLGAKQL